MAYADSLDDTSPLDTDLISLGDDAIRKLARALIERLESIIVDLDADPLVIKPDAIVPAAGSVTQAMLDPGIPLVKLIFGTVTGSHTIAAESGAAPILAVVPNRIGRRYNAPGASGTTSRF
jgi:hypothetical protein